MKKRLPKMFTDREAKELLKQDLSDYIHPGNFHPVRFELARKDRSVTLRLSEGLFQELKKAASKRKTRYQRLIRLAIEQFLHEEVK